MSTLKELLKDRELPVKAKCEQLSGVYYELTHKNKAYALMTGYDIETNQKIHDTSFMLSSENWELYTEPKKKVKVALYAYKHKNDKRWCYTSHFYKDDKDFLGSFGSQYKFKRLDYTEIEIESDDE